MKKRIIVLADLTDSTASLIRYAQEWSINTGSAIHIVHQTHVFTPGVSDKNSKEEFAKPANDEALQKLKTLCDAIFGIDNNITYTVSIGTLQSTIQKLLEEPFEHILFSGIKNTGFLRKLFIGSTTLKTIENTSTALAAIPGDIPLNFPEKVYVAISEQQPLNFSEFNKLVKWFPVNKTELVFFNVSDSTENTENIEQQLNKLTGLYSDKFKCSYKILKNENTLSGIKNIISDKNKELLVIQKGSRFFTDMIFRKLLVHELVYDGHTPFIVLH